MIDLPLVQDMVLGFFYQEFLVGCVYTLYSIVVHYH